MIEMKNINNRNIKLIEKSFQTHRVNMVISCFKAWLLFVLSYWLYDMDDCCNQHGNDWIHLENKTRNIREIFSSIFIYWERGKIYEDSN